MQCAKCQWWKVPLLQPKSLLSYELMLMWYLAANLNANVSSGTRYSHNYWDLLKSLCFVSPCDICPWPMRCNGSLSCLRTEKTIKFVLAMVEIENDRHFEWINEFTEIQIHCWVMAFIFSCFSQLMGFVLEKQQL